jgi:hypothetical protein
MDSGIFLIIILLSLFASAAIGSQGQSLHKKFIKSGVLIGKTEAEITKVVGTPSSRSAMVGGGSLLQWQATGYHIALLFDGNRVCKKITHEFVHRG